MHKQILRVALLAVVLTSLAACNREPQPLVNPVGSWQGTLTTMTGGSGTQAFTAEISGTSLEYADYAGTFTVEDKRYNVTGNFNGRYEEGEYFAFQAPPEELRSTLSPVIPLGFNWSGVMTATEYTGEWFITEEDRGLSRRGTFNLERLP